MKFIFSVHSEKLNPTKMLLLDRDGVVIKDTGYPFSKSQIIFEEKNIEKIKNVKISFNYDLCGFITNQSGVGRKYFSEKQFWDCHKYILKECHFFGLTINFTAVNFFTKNSYYRKPEPGMINQSKLYFKIRNSNILFIGDRKTDEDAAYKSGIRFSYVDQL